MIGWVENDLFRLGLALIGSALISILAYRLRALSISGAIAAFAMGVSFVFFGEPIWFALLLTFFISSTFWSKFKRRSASKKMAEAQYEKSGRRDAMQVFANGGLGMILCILSYYFDERWILPIFIMIMAIVNADTWATEIGSLSRSKPRHIVNGKFVEAGTSGGITGLGTLAALAGSALIGTIATIFTQEWTYIMLATVAGVVGCMIDSLLGATVQRMFKCTVCDKITERKVHCNQPTDKLRGALLINNDIVNLASSILGSFAVWIVYIALF